jgi:hypothetical protein
VSDQDEDFSGPDPFDDGSRCYITYNDKREPIGHLCGRLGEPCPDCGSAADFLCDYPVGDGKTCDRRMCEYRAHEIGPEVHYCDHHHAEWSAYVAGGGERVVLRNVEAWPAVRGVDYQCQRCRGVWLRSFGQCPGCKARGSLVRRSRT